MLVFETLQDNKKNNMETHRSSSGGGTSENWALRLPLGNAILDIIESVLNHEGRKGELVESHHQVHQPRAKPETVFLCHIKHLSENLPPQDRQFLAHLYEPGQC